jgi:hypothetical protein
VRARGQARAEGLARGRVLPLVRLRLKVGDDRWGPPVGSSGRAAEELGRAGPKQRVGSVARRR